MDNHLHYTFASSNHHACKGPHDRSSIILITQPAYPKFILLFKDVNFAFFRLSSCTAVDFCTSTSIARLSFQSTDLTSTSYTTETIMVIIPHAWLRSILATLSLCSGSQGSYSTAAGTLRI